MKGRRRTIAILAKGALMSQLGFDVSQTKVLPVETQLGMSSRVAEPRMKGAIWKRPFFCMIRAGGKGSQSDGPIRGRRGRCTPSEPKHNIILICMSVSSFPRRRSRRPLRTLR